MRHNIIDSYPLITDKRTKLLLIGLVLVGCFFLFYFWVKRPAGIHKSINKLVIKGHNKLSTREIVAVLGIQPGVSFEQFDLSVLEKNMLLHPRVRDVKISRQFYDRLLISITERNASFAVQSGGHLYEIDEDLKIISTDDVRDSELCVLSGEFAIGSGHIAGSRIRDLTSFVKQAFEMYPALKDRISEFHLASDGEIYIFIYRPKRIKVLMGTTMDLTGIRKLYAALAFFEAEDKKSELLDLRGEDAVYH